MNYVDPKSAPTAVDARYRVMLIIWLAMLSSMSLYFLLTKFIEVPAADGAGTILWVDARGLNHRHLISVEADVFIQSFP